MPRKSSAADEILDLVARLPWWTGVVHAVVTYVVFHALAAQTIPPPAGVAQAGAFAIEIVVKTGSGLLQGIVPASCLAAAGVSAWRDRRRHALAAGMG